MIVMIVLGEEHSPFTRKKRRRRKKERETLVSFQSPQITIYLSAPEEDYRQTVKFTAGCNTFSSFRQITSDFDPERGLLLHQIQDLKVTSLLSEIKIMRLFLTTVILKKLLTKISSHVREDLQSLVFFS